MATRSNASTASNASTEHHSFLNPDNATAGLRNMFEGTIVDARYEDWDFKGKAKRGTDFSGRAVSGHKFALHLVLDDIDDGGGKTEDVYWPGMAIEDCVPNDDGTGFEFITGKKGFPRDSELIQGMDYFIETGAIMKSDIDDDPSWCVGKRFFWERKPAKWAKPVEGKEPPSNLMPTKYIETASGSGSGNGKARGASTRPAAASSSASSKAQADTDTDDAIVDRAIELTMEALADLPPKQKTISREDLGSEVLALMLQKYKKEISTADRKAIGKLYEDDEFLQSNSGRKTWKYDAEDGEVTRT